MPTVSTSTATACAAPKSLQRLDDSPERNNNSHSQHGPVSGGRHHLGIRGRNHLGNEGRLRRNRQLGLIDRDDCERDLRGFDYKITALGRQVLPVIAALREWEGWDG
ncbi:winged helix-turn-helix transcriptional regulator [Sphingobium sp.]|uniref:winged helix-turn-helix transcriptional regulator n=1 Tax=Sphingobium sp. TaxID=1912891 RepID=UPI0039C93907